MKLVVIKSHLKDALRAVIGVTTEHANLPILKNVRVDAHDGKIILTATNLEVAIEYSLLGKVLEPGVTTLPAATLVNIINNLQSERLTISANAAHAVEITTDNYNATLQGAPPDEFPLIPKVKEAAQTTT